MVTSYRRSQNIGNTMSIIGYTFSVSYAVFFGRISARKKFSSLIHLAQQETAEPNFHQILRDGLETDGPTTQTRAEEEWLTLKTD